MEGEEPADEGVGLEDVEEELDAVALLVLGCCHHADGKVT
jgi:hypothetical protein